jgi:outer membrane receptor protein involved in Fe transport
MSWTSRRVAISGGLRAYSSQFDDDLNQYLLPGYATLMAVVRAPIAKGFSASAAFENLLDHTYLVAFTPTPNTGQPYMWRLGLRWH